MWTTTTYATYTQQARHTRNRSIDLHLFQLTVVLSSPTSSLLNLRATRLNFTRNGLRLDQAPVEEGHLLRQPGGLKRRNQCCNEEGSMEFTILILLFRWFDFERI